MRILRVVLACALATSPVVAAPDDVPAPPTSPRLSELDAQVIAHLHAVNQLEIELGTMAQRNGSPPVKSYGEMLVADHTGLDVEVIALAKQKGLDPIPADATLSPAEQKDLAVTRAKLEAARGDAFDRPFLELVITDDDKELTTARSNLALVHDADLARMLTELQPTLRRHSEEARKLQSPLRAAR